MLSSGDVVDLDLGMPEGREAGLQHPAIVVAGHGNLDADPPVVHVVPTGLGLPVVGPHPGARASGGEDPDGIAVEWSISHGGGGGMTFRPGAARHRRRAG